MLVVRFLYYIITFLCIGISGYTTYYGFEKSLGDLTLVFSIVIVLMLFSADFLIQKRREATDSITLPVILLIVTSVFSGLSSFNYLYTNFMEDEVLEQTLRSQYAVFYDDLVSTELALSSIETVRREVDRRNRVETELQNMWQQMRDEGRPGCGSRCAEHIDKIHGIIGTTITDLARPGPGASTGELDDFHKRFSGLVYTAMDNAPYAENYVEVAALRSEIAETIRYFGTADEAISDGADLDRLAELSQTSQKIERKANSLLPADEKIAHTFIDPTLGRLGEIAFSLENGFVERPNNWITVISLMIAVLVDYIPLFFAIVAFRVGESISPTREDDNPFDVLS